MSCPPIPSGPTHILVPHFGPMLHEDKILQMILAKKVYKKKNKIKKGAKKGRCPDGLSRPHHETAKGKNVISQSKRKPPKGRFGQNQEPLCVKTPNRARRKKLEGASLGENLKRGAWTSNVVKKKKGRV